MKLYSRPFLLWLVCPLLLYWVTRVWFVARRGGLSEDPLLYCDEGQDQPAGRGPDRDPARPGKRLAEGDRVLMATGWPSAGSARSHRGCRLSIYPRTIPAGIDKSMTFRVAARKIGAWSNFPVHDCFAFRPEKLSELRELPASGRFPDYISRGMGRGYGDAGASTPAAASSSTSGSAASSTSTPPTGVVDAEGGACFADVIKAFLPRGWFLPVTPGTKFVTVGGAIAADVHGKNHHRRRRVRPTSSRASSCSPAPAKSSHCSPRRERRRVLGDRRRDGPDRRDPRRRGCGCAGARPPTSTSDYQKARDLDGRWSCSPPATGTYRYSVAWIDCLATGESLGRSVLMRGDHAPAGGAADGGTRRAADARRRSAKKACRLTSCRRSC